MAFTFVHTADWQIGKAFGRFPADVGVQLRAARLDAIDRIAEVAREAAARHVVVAGDVVDSEHIDDAGLRQLLARLSNRPDLTWHLLPGNHDPSRVGGVWPRLDRLGLPANARAHLAPAPVEIEPGIALLPAPLTAKETRTDPTLWMDDAPSGDGVIRIGIAHGSVRGFGSLGEAAVPIDATRRQSARLDYFALGDWHGVKEIAPGVWYAGTPEADSFAENNPGHVLVVRIAAAGAEPEVTVVPTSRYRWLDRRVVLSRLADLDPIEAEIAAFGEGRTRLLLSLELDGAIAATEAAALDERLSRLAALPLSTRVGRSRLRIHASGADAGLIADPTLAAVARRIAARAESDNATEARIAGRAMRLLLAFGAAAAPRSDPVPARQTADAL